MRGNARRILPVTLLTIYGVVTLSGHALHVPNRLGHGLAIRVSDEGTTPDQHEDQGRASHDCPTCHFNAQGQLLVDSAGEPTIEFWRRRTVPRAPLCFPLPLDHLSLPRAPPLARLNASLT